MMILTTAAAALLVVLLFHAGEITGSGSGGSSGGSGGASGSGSGQASPPPPSFTPEAKAAELCANIATVNKCLEKYFVTVGLQREELSKMASVPNKPENMLHFAVRLFACFCFLYYKNSFFLAALKHSDESRSKKKSENLEKMAS